VLRNTAARLTLLLAVVIVYHNAMWASFFDDDFQWLVGSWSFRPAQLVAFGSMNHFYRPMIDIYFAVMTPVTDGSPVLFHEASIALHAANVLVIFALARRIGGSDLFGFSAALFFAVQPSDIDAIAWVGALAEALGALFGCLSLLWFFWWRDDGQPRWRTLSVIAFALALLTHESSVVFLPVLFLADWLFVERRELIRPFVPYLSLTGVYLALDLWINSRNYVVSQGYYTLGFHLVTNALDYIAALYVGRRDWLNYAVIVIGVAMLFVVGNTRMRFATCWMLLALAPFLAFNWGNTSRYLYQPAIGFSLLLAEAVVTVDRAIGRRVSVGTRPAIVTALVAMIAIRFTAFAAANVHDFADRSRVYADYLGRFREIHGTLPANTTVVADPATKLPYQFINAAVQWDYRDPTIRIAPYE
jgi:hypothetical protein